MKWVVKIFLCLFFAHYDSCLFAQDSAKHAPSSFYFGGHVSPQVSILGNSGFTTTSFAASFGMDMLKRISNKFYFKMELDYSYQRGQLTPYWAEFIPSAMNELNYEKWSLLKTPLTINYFYYKQGLIIIYPSIGIEQAFHLEKFNNEGIGQWSSTWHYPLINIYGIIGMGCIYNVSEEINLLLEVRFEHNITNLAFVPNDSRDKYLRKVYRENNMLMMLSFGILFNSKKKILSNENS